MDVITLSSPDLTNPPVASDASPDSSSKRDELTEITTARDSLPNDSIAQPLDGALIGGLVGGLLSLLLIATLVALFVHRRRRRRQQQRDSPMLQQPAAVSGNYGNISAVPAQRSQYDGVPKARIENHYVGLSPAEVFGSAGGD
jgi:predicted lipid-binding transport protein (Tim44 family)